MAPGIQLMFASVQNDLKCKADVAVCYMHFELISRGYSCVGVGEKVTADPKDVERSELLPSNWNNGDIYALLYWPSNSQNTVLLKIIKVDDQLLVHLMRLSDEFVTEMTLEVSDFVGDDFKAGHKSLKSVEQLHKRMERELVRPIETASSKKTEKQEEKKKEEPRSPLEEDPLRVNRPGASNYPPYSDPMDPFQVGRADLDPLSGGGGGMLMDPFQRQGGFPRPGFDPSTGLPGRLPPGAVPPGSRFDPFGPPNPDAGMFPGRRPAPRPDPDFPSPPGYDDMFM